MAVSPSLPPLCQYTCSQRAQAIRWQYDPMEMLYFNNTVLYIYIIMLRYFGTYTYCVYNSEVDGLYLRTQILT